MEKLKMALQETKLGVNLLNRKTKVFGWPICTIKLPENTTVVAWEMIRNTIVKNDGMIMDIEVIQDKLCINVVIKGV